MFPGIGVGEAPGTVAGGVVMGVGNSAGVGVAPAGGKLTPPPDCTVGVATPPGAEPAPPPPPPGPPAVGAGVGGVPCVLVLEAEACSSRTRSTTAAITTAAHSTLMGKSRQRP